ncbi:MAG: hypothetical protein CM15mP114_15900 [Alphaproteobacteria bacterium]|nr:MAG: hypothetical protein CM15mP114_15900 [Alphaproteobacteria bacterium]
MTTRGLEHLKNPNITNMMDIINIGRKNRKK